MLIKTLKAISKSTGFLAKALDKSKKTTEDVLKKEYLYNISRFLKDTSGEVVEKIGYAAGKIEDVIDNRSESN